MIIQIVDSYGVVCCVVFLLFIDLFLYFKKAYLFQNESDDDEDAEIARLRVSPPPTPINRFLQSVNIYKKNQIKVAIPKFILRGLGRDSYHVFEVKVINYQFFESWAIVILIHIAAKLPTHKIKDQEINTKNSI